jgi:hypothetical protein
MTTGIYLLKFTGCNSIYIGQSVNIELRYSKHLLSFRNKTANYKMMKAFYKHGVPQLEILCECLSDELNIYEKEAFDIFNIKEIGLNIALEPDIHLAGPKNGAAKYLEEEILHAFELLCEDPQKYPKYSSISTICNVSEETIRHISNGEAHSWLKDMYPEKYSQMVINSKLRRGASNSAAAKGITYPKIVKDGLIVSIDNANKFARENGLDSSYLIKLLNGKANSCKGWKIYNE